MIFRDAEPWIAEAVGSVVRQDYLALEIVLVDDGSCDDSIAEAERAIGSFPGPVVWCRHPGHENRGMTASRRLGVDSASGAYVAFLDADDRWDRSRVSSAVELLEANPDVALACGRATNWRSWNGGMNDLLGLLGEPGEVIHPPQSLLRVLRDPSLRTPICDLTVRMAPLRKALDHGGDFRDMYEDQVLLAQLYATEKVVVNGTLASAYRQHAESASNKALRVGRYHPGWPNRSRVRYLTWLRTYCAELDGNHDELRRAVDRELVRQGPAMTRRLPVLLDGINVARRALRYLGPRRSLARLRRPVAARGARASLLALRAFVPVSRTYGFERGLPVDRFFIEQFLAEHAAAISGHTLEVGDDSYTTRYGTAITRRDILHVASIPGATIVGRLEDPATLAGRSFHSIVCVQTLQFIDDLPTAVRALRDALVPGGTLLVTLPGMSALEVDESPDSPWLWSFTEHSARRLFSPYFEEVLVHSYGNATVAAAFIVGLTARDVAERAFRRQDPQFPVLVTVCCRRAAASSPGSAHD